MWSKWQSHFGLCGLTICETASTWDAVTQIEDNKTNRKESDEDDEEKEGDGGQLVDQSLQSWFFLLLLTSCNSALSQYLQSFHHHGIYLPCSSRCQQILYLATQNGYTRESRCDISIGPRSLTPDLECGLGMVSRLA